LQITISYGNSFTNLENGDFISVMKREEQTQVLEMLDKNYIWVNICVILLTKFNSYLCVYMELHLKILTLKVCVDIHKVMQVPFHFPDSGSTSPQTIFLSDVFKNLHPSFGGSDKA